VDDEGTFSVVHETKIKLNEITPLKPHTLKLLTKLVFSKDNKDKKATSVFKSALKKRNIKIST
jgi:hypothetical protein